MHESLEMMFEDMRYNNEGYGFNINVEKCRTYHSDCLFIVRVTYWEILRKRLAVGVSEEEVERGRNIYKTIIFSALESSVTRADDIAKQVCKIFLRRTAGFIHVKNSGSMC